MPLIKRGRLGPEEDIAQQQGCEREMGSKLRGALILADLEGKELGHTINADAGRLQKVNSQVARMEESTLFDIEGSVINLQLED
ncbi:hypothetical protein CR513_09348, partial [Mucuna pruriens]